MDIPWNHNTVYHPEILARAGPGTLALDVGCGDGLLVGRLAERGARVTGIDSDASAIARAWTLLDQPARRPSDRVRLIAGDVMSSQQLTPDSFDLLSCVAALHHLPMTDALERFAELLRPGGRLVIVGLHANRGVLDWLLAAASVLPIRLIGLLRRETSSAAMVTAAPEHSLAEIRREARRVLPGVRVRRRFFYRCTLTWTKPTPA